MAELRGCCGRETALFDASRHGWDGFVCRMPVEETAESSVACKACGGNCFGVTVMIRSQGRDDFIQESNLEDGEGNALREDEWADAFEWIRADLECAGCGRAAALLAGQRDDVRRTPWVTFPLS